MFLHKFVKSVTSSVPVRTFWHWANVCFSAHAISQPCRHTTSETFRKGYAKYIRYQILYVASAQEWDFTAQMLCWFCAVAHPRGTLVTRESGRFGNNDIEPKSQVSLLKAPEENWNFWKTHVVESILLFSQCQNENECILRRGNCRRQSERKLKQISRLLEKVPSQIWPFPRVKTMLCIPCKSIQCYVSVMTVQLANRLLQA